MRFQIRVAFEAHAIRAAFQLLLLALMFDMAVSAGDLGMAGNLILVMLGSRMTRQAGGVVD